MTDHKTASTPVSAFPDGFAGSGTGRMVRVLAPLTALLLSLGAGLPASADGPKVFDEIKIGAGKALFEAECRRCHSVDADRASYGPLLDGVIGRQAGSVPDYPYSPALAKASFVWTEPALKAWIEDNQGFVPGTKMRHVGISDPVVQDFILAYLGSLHQ